MEHARASAQTRPSLSTNEVRLLLLLSRPALTDEQQELAAELVAKVQQWPVFIDTAFQKYVLPMVYQHLAVLSGGVPQNEMIAMRALSMRITSEMLRRHAAFDWFHERCVLISGVDYAYFKGHALAARFYPDPLQRFYRDVDILVPNAARGRLMRCMLDAGCKVYLETDAGTEELNFDTEEQLAEFLHMYPVPSVVTPQGLLVEIHGEIDQQTSLFSSPELLRSTQTVSTLHNRVKTLPDAAHIAFICYHHTRHIWSKLHWLADLAAICSHPEFDKSAALTYGRDLHIESTIAAALELHELASSGRHPSDLDRPTPGGDLLCVCVDALRGDLKLEKEMRRHQRMDAISFEWQGVPVSLRRRGALLLRKLRPVYSDFRTVPGGRKLWWFRYAIASVKRLLDFCVRQIRKTFLQ